MVSQSSFSKLKCELLNLKKKLCFNQGAPLSRQHLQRSQAGRVRTAGKTNTSMRVNLQYDIFRRTRRYDR